VVSRPALLVSDRRCQCGCQHSQHLGGPCEGCGACLSWRLPDEMAQARLDHEYAELGEFPAGSTLPTTTAFVILDSLDTLEAQIDELGWDQVPKLLIMHAIPGTAGRTFGIQLDELNHPALRLGNDSIVEGLEEACWGERPFLIQGRSPFPPVGLALLQGAWRHDPTLHRRIAAVDVDQRVYEVIRTRGGGQRSATMQNMAALRQRIAETEGPIDHTLRLPRVLAALVEAMTVTAAR